MAEVSGEIKTEKGDSKQNCYTTPEVSDLLRYFDRHILEQFQRAISKATGLAFITVDHQGKPVTENTNFTEHCQYMRNHPENRKNCFSSDAYGAKQAAARNCPYIYFCPHGIIEMAVPIVIHGQYMGGFIGGQFRCSDAPSTVCRFSGLMSPKESMNERNLRLRLFKKIPRVSYTHIVDVSKLAALIINQLCVQELNKQDAPRKYSDGFVARAEEINVQSVSAPNPIQEILSIFQCHDYSWMYHCLGKICDELAMLSRSDPHQLKELMLHIGQTLLDNSELAGSGIKQSILFYYPLDEAYVQDRMACALWLSDVLDLCFQKKCLQSYPVMKPVFQYIDAHLNSAISLNTIVQNCAISQGYLSRIFKEQYHVSVMDYLHLRRTFQAKGYLYFTELTVSQIAFRLGYNESSYFSKIFKKYVGLTCREYREKIRKKGSVHT